MRSVIRVVAPLLAVAAIALGGASSALAASPVSSTQPVDEAWCFDDGAMDYCFTVKGSAHYVTNDSRESVVMNTRFHTDFYENGVFVGESTVTSLDKFLVGADGRYVQQTVSHTTSRLGDETCRIQVVWRSDDFETVVDQWNGGCTGA